MSVPWYLMAKGKGGGGYKTASGLIVSVNDALAAPLRSLLVNIDPVQEGTGDPSPDNVRPISGWSAVNVWRTGVNVWDEEWELGTFLNTNGTKYPSTTKIRSKNPIPVKPNTTYYYYVGSTSADEDRIWCYDADMNFIRSFSYTHQTTIGAIFTTPANCSYINFAIKNTTYNNDISINYPSTDHDYHPYSGNQYTIQLGQTVYGGTLDVTNGVLTVDRVMKDLGNLDWVYDATYIRFNSQISDAKRVNPPRVAYLLCSAFKPITDGRTLANVPDMSIYRGSNYDLSVHDSAYTDATAFKTAVSGVQIVYELATPITIPLTPTEISTLAGQNVVWADCGDVTVEYLSAGGANPDLMKLAVAFMGRK